MNILFNNDELVQLMTNLYTLTGIRGSIFDFNGKDICLTGGYAPYCQLINGCSEGLARCLECDARAVRACSSAEEIHFYRCHAGLCEAVIPIVSDGTPIAYLAFGQHLDSTPLEQQWIHARAGLDWYPGDMDKLKEAFFQLRRYSPQEITAYAEVLKALASYIHLSGLIQPAEYTELQQLEIYLDRHYMEKLSLNTISQELNISRTKLCSLAKRLSGGKTLSAMIAERRVSAAKLLLMKSDTPISAVAESVGVTDYNYFTKVFRSVTGMTPSAFRKAHRHNIK